MTWLAPWMVTGAAAAAAVAVALHLIAWDRPQPSPLPTSRFVPDPREVPAARRTQLVDIALLVLRLFTILLIGAAFARPMLTPSRRGAMRVVLVDQSRAVASPAEARDSANAWRRDRDPLVAFDSGGGARGSISAALIAAVRGVEGTRARPESSEVVLVTPLLAEEVDAATTSVRAVWAGSLRLVRVKGPVVDSTPPSARVETRGTGDDAVIAAARLLPPSRNRARIVRGAVTAADSSFASAGGTLLHWPHVTPGTHIDAALVSARSVAIARFERPASNEATAGGTPVLRWTDGATAAAEGPLGAGCVRTVFAGVPEGDAVLRPRFLALLAELVGPCGNRVDPAPAPDSAVRSLVQASTNAQVRSADLANGMPLAPWLLAAAAMTAMAELFVRKRR